LVPARLRAAGPTSGPAVTAALSAARRTAGPETLGGQTQGGHRVSGVLRARVHHRHRRCGRFFVFVVVRVGCRNEQPDGEGARNHSEPDGQEGARGHARGDASPVHASPVHASPDDARTTVYAAQGNGSCSENSTVHASSDNSRGNTLAYRVYDAS
jgi:hypothetical protein